MSKSSMFSYPRQDSVAGVVVFLIALPLCLGIAIACGVPPLSGLIAGMVGGVVVPLFSRSPLSVTGPAAGLTSVVLLEIQRLGGLEPFVAAVVIAGFFQVVLGLFRLGRFSTLVPAAVVRGMLAAIGIIIVLKQLPVAFGVNDGLSQIFRGVHLGATLIGVLSLGVLYGWKKTPLSRIQFLPAPLAVVFLGSFLAGIFSDIPSLALSSSQFVDVPLGGIQSLFSALPRPDFSSLQSQPVWIAGFTIAMVASIETLLSCQAVDRLDPWSRRTPPNRELVAQGIGNALSGLLGGLPVTSVIVRSGANVAAGGRERLSAFIHGILLLVAVVFLGSLLNAIPLTCLAAVLIQVGLNLAKPSVFIEQRKLGWAQLLPFILTVLAVIFTDILKGVIFGIFVGIVFILRQNSIGAVSKETKPDGSLLVRFRRDGTFLVKPLLLTLLEEIPDHSRVVIDGSGEYLDQDVKESLASFLLDSKNRGIYVETVGIDLSLVSGKSGH